MGCAGCTTCGTGESSSKVGGCNSNGCKSGGCNRLNTFDWLSFMDIPDVEEFHIVEVSFKNGSRKEFLKNQPHNRTVTGDMVVVETGNGYDIGRISLSGDLVRLQMKKKKVTANDIMHFVLRKANERDLDRLEEARALEYQTMVRARVIARTLDLNMKIGDVEYQGDKRKATFYYIADGRVDFRELIRHYAKEFRVKIEMRQIGARQESARIGGIGSCGRELCCSTWLTDFKSVSTAAARYQNLAINQAKLSGMCGRLKCCLNYELDTYLDALENFPKGVDKIKTKKGTAILVKTDIFKGLMFYVYEHERGRGKFYPLELKRVKQIQKLNRAGEFPHDLVDIEAMLGEITIDYGDVTGAVELPTEKRRSKRNRGRRKNKSSDTTEKKKAPKSSAPTDMMSTPFNKAKSASRSMGTLSDTNGQTTKSEKNTSSSSGKSKKDDRKPFRKSNRKPKNDAKGGTRNDAKETRDTAKKEGRSNSRRDFKNRSKDNRSKEEGTKNPLSTSKEGNAKERRSNARRDSKNNPKTDALKNTAPKGNEGLKQEGKSQPKEEQKGTNSKSTRSRGRGSRKNNPKNDAGQTNNKTGNHPRSQRKPRPDNTGKPQDKAKSQNTGKPQDKARPENTNKPQDKAKSQNTGKPQDKTRPENTNKPTDNIKPKNNTPSDKKEG